MKLINNQQVDAIVPSWQVRLPKLIEDLKGSQADQADAIDQLEKMASRADIFDSGILTTLSEEEPKHIQVAQAAWHVFWELVSFNYPAATTGDIDPVDQVSTELIVEDAVKNWAMWNDVPLKDIEEAKAFLRSEMDYIGWGFHPDTDFKDYVIGSENALMYSVAAAASMNAKMRKAFDLFDDSEEDIYAFCIDYLSNKFKSDNNETGNIF